MVLRVGIEDERGESAEAIDRIVYHLGNRCLKSIIAAVSVQTRIVSEPLGVCSATDLVIGLIEISGGENQVAFPDRVQSQSVARR